MTGLAGETITDGAPALDMARAETLLAGLPGWALTADGRGISRE